MDMENKVKIDSKSYDVNVYSMNKIYTYVNDNKLVLNENQTKRCLLKTIKKRDCLMFDQFEKVLKLENSEFNFTDKSNISKYLIELDFNDFKLNKLTTPKYIDTITLTINNEKIVYKDFLKSNSMSKESKVYYINNNYYKKMIERTILGLDKDLDKPLSKLYAYSGLSISDCYIMHNIELDYNRIAVIEDEETEIKSNCITAISLDLFFSKFKKMLGELTKFQDNNAGFEIYGETIHDTSIKTIVANIGESAKKCFKKIYNYLKSIDDLYENKEMIAYDIKGNPIKDFTKMEEIELNKFNKGEYKDREILYLVINNVHNNMGLIIENDSSNSLIYSNHIFNDLYNFIEKMVDICETYTKAEKNENKSEWVMIEANNYSIKTKKYDGLGLASNEFIKKINDELKTNGLSSFQIRLPFIKGMIHECDFKKFFMDNGIEKIKTLDGEKYVKDLDLILTDSQVKACSYINDINSKYKGNKQSLSDFFNKLKAYDYHLGISQVEVENKDIANFCYQFLSTLPLEESYIDEVIQNNKENIKEKISYDAIANELKKEEMQSIKNKQSYRTLADLYYLNKDFYTNTMLFKNKRLKMFNSLKNKYELGKFEIDGSRKFIAPDLLEMLYYIANRSNKKIVMKEEYKLGEYDYYATDYSLNDDILVLRNPHYSVNEAIVLHRVDALDIRKKYFAYDNKLKSVLFFSPTKLIADRLGGADYDGDAVAIINDNKMVSNVLEKLSNEHYKLAKIPSYDKKSTEKNNKFDNFGSRIRTLNNTFDSRVGLISNIAFNDVISSKNIIYDETKMEDKIKKDRGAFYTILGGLEIDSQKNGSKPVLPTQNGKNLFLNLKSKVEDNKDIGTLRDKLNKKDDIIYRIFKEFYYLKYDNSNENKEFKLKDNSINKDALKKLIVISKIYKLYEAAINRFDEIDASSFDNDRQYINNYFQTRNKSEIIKLISKLEILNINYLKYSNSFTKYCENTFKYHYLSSFLDKLDYMKNRLDIDYMTDEEMALFTDFSNDGYMDLYLALRCLYKLDYEYEFKLKYNIEYNNEEEFEKKFNKKFTFKKDFNLSINDKHDIWDSFTKLKDDINEKIKNENRNKYNNIIVNVIKEYGSNIEFEDLFNYFGNEKISMYFKFFDDVILNYFKRRDK